MRFALNFYLKNAGLIDFTDSAAERDGLYFNCFGYYATITYLLRGQCTVYYASWYPFRADRGFTTRFPWWWFKRVVTSFIRKYACLFIGQKFSIRTTSPWSTCQFRIIIPKCQVTGTHRHPLPDIFLRFTRVQVTKCKSWSYLLEGGTHKRQISKQPTPHPPVSISANNNNRQSQRLGWVRLVAALVDLKFGGFEHWW